MKQDENNLVSQKKQKKKKLSEFIMT